MAWKTYEKDDCAWKDKKEENEEFSVSTGILSIIAVYKEYIFKLLRLSCV